MRLLVLLGALLCICPAVSVCRAGQTPYAEYCLVLPMDNHDPCCGKIPGVATEDPEYYWYLFQAYIVDQYWNPIPNCLVEVQVLFAGYEGCRCQIAQWDGRTNDFGYVKFPLLFGGYGEAPAAGVVWADLTYPIRWYQWVVSPDFNGAGGDCDMSLDDFTHFGVCWGTTDPSCDYDGTCAVSLADFTLFGHAWGDHCSPALR